MAKRNTTIKIIKKTRTKRGKTKAIISRFVSRNYANKATMGKNMVDLGKGFPKKLCITHKYSEIVQVTSTSGVLGTYQFSCNGMYDPNFTGTGHQPYYFDQFGAIYDHYCVIGSKISVKFVPTSAAQTAIMATLFVNDDNALAVGTVDGLAETQTAKYRIINNSSTDSVRTFGAKWSAKKYFGGDVLANTELQGTTSANPTEQSFYTICVQAMDKANTVSIYAEVMIQYIAVWKELKDIAQS